MSFLKIITLAVLFCIAFIYNSTAQTTSPAASDTSKTIQLKVKGITCSADLKTIAANVEKLKGVYVCKAGKMGPTSGFNIQFNPVLVSEKEITAAIEATSGCEDPADRPYKVKK